MTRKAEGEILLGGVCAALYLGIWFLYGRPMLYLNHVSSIHALFLIMYFFGAIGILLFFHRARWARVAMSAFAFSAALILGWWSVHAFFAAVIPNWERVSAFTLAGVHFSRVLFAFFLTTIASIAVGFGVFGSWILKRES